MDDCHWVTVVRREVHENVLFLYADDLTNMATEVSIRTLLATKTSREFYPATAQWIHCRNFTYRPHSNECGPRSLLAATILALHPARWIITQAGTCQPAQKHIYRPVFILARTDTHLVRRMLNTCCVFDRQASKFAS